MRLLFYVAIPLLLCAALVKADLSKTDIFKRDIAVKVNVGDRNSSYIIIGDVIVIEDVATASADEITLGSNISIPLLIYRGSTLKLTVYVWIVNSSGAAVSTKSKLSIPTRFISYNLSANISFLRCFSNGDFRIVAEGLDVNATKPVDLSVLGCADDWDEQIPAVMDKEVSFSISDSVSTIRSGENFRTRVLALNPTEEDLEFDAWSYVFRSSKCYSGEREENRLTINLPAFSNVTFDLDNVVNASAGNYTLKVKLLLSGRSTPKEFSIPLKVISDSSGSIRSANKITSAAVTDSSVSNASKRKINTSNVSSSNQGVVFRSSSAKARDMTIYFLIILLALILVILLFKRL